MEHLLWFFAGSFLGASVGFITALLCVHGRAQDLAQKILLQRSDAGTGNSYSGKTSQQAVN